MERTTTFGNSIDEQDAQAQAQWEAEQVEDDEIEQPICVECETYPVLDFGGRCYSCTRAVESRYHVSYEVAYANYLADCSRFNAITADDMPW
jgi:hypothetical protein